jgi:hypothetical protein
MSSKYVQFQQTGLLRENGVLRQKVEEEVANPSVNLLILLAS